MTLKVESEKVGLKLKIQKTKIMASGPMTPWQIDRETVETGLLYLFIYLFVCLFVYLVSKISADGDCSHEMKRHLLLGRKVMTNLESIFKSSDLILSTKVHLVKALVLLMIIYGCESFTVMRAVC